MRIASGDSRVERRGDLWGDDVLRSWECLATEGSEGTEDRKGFWENRGWRRVLLR